MNTFLEVIAYLDTIFTPHTIYVLSMVLVAGLLLLSLRKPMYKTQDELDYEEMCAAYAEEAEAHYANEVVECSGMCLCENLYVFTTTEQASRDHEFCTMIACSHCPVCNPEGLVDVVEDTAPALTVVSEVQEGERVKFTFNDGSTAIMRAYTFKGNCAARQLDAPSEGGYRVDNIQQARAIDAFTGIDYIPF